MAEKGYVGTSVQDVLKEAAVSRRAFYELFTSKLDCFLTAFDYAGMILRRRMLEGVQADPAGRTQDPVDQFDRGLTAYLSALASELAFARVFLVESYVAGPEAISRRASIQGDIAGALATLMRATGPSGRYTCSMIIAAVSTMVTAPVAEGDADAIRAIGPPVVAHVRRLWELGAFAEPAGQGK
ncbi:MAG: TetR/AcrR family transcriptional regulator [Nocardiopsaceae bacterium]|nr:TetR/AcrR family transcriptional regulator [Nocardiopsaceae bacterium]